MIDIEAITSALALALDDFKPKEIRTAQKIEKKVHSSWYEGLSEHDCFGVSLYLARVTKLAHAGITDQRDPKLINKLAPVFNLTMFSDAAREKMSHSMPSTEYVLLWRLRTSSQENLVNVLQSAKNRWVSEYTFQAYIEEALKNPNLSTILVEAMSTTRYFNVTDRQMIIDSCLNILTLDQLEIILNNRINVGLSLERVTTHLRLVLNADAHLPDSWVLKAAGIDDSRLEHENHE